MNGKEKSQLILALLGDRASGVLSYVEPDVAQQLTDSIGDIESRDPSDIIKLIQEVMLESRRFVTLPKEAQSVTSGDFSLDGFGDDSSQESDSEDSFLSSFENEEPESGGFMDMMGEPEEDVLSEAMPDSAPVSDENSHLRSPLEVAEILQSQRPQIAAFILSKLEEDLRDELYQFMDDRYKAKVDALDIEDIPMSDAVYECLYEAIFIRPPDLEDDEPAVETSSFGGDSFAADTKMESAFSERIDSPDMDDSLPDDVYDVVDNGVDSAYMPDDISYSEESVVESSEPVKDDSLSFDDAGSYDRMSDDDMSTLELDSEESDLGVQVSVQHDETPVQSVASSAMPDSLFDEFSDDDLASEEEALL